MSTVQPPLKTQRPNRQAADTSQWYRPKTAIRASTLHPAMHAEVRIPGP